MSSSSSKWRLHRALLAGACVAALAGCGGDGDETATTTTSQTSPPQPETSPLRDRLNRLVEQLLTERGLDPSVAACALDELATTLPDARVEAAIAAIRETGEPPPAVVAAAARAGAACGGS